MLSQLFEQKIEVNGSGRTDAGVHAVGQVANFLVNTQYGPDKIAELMNRYLPKDIAVTGARLADARFHARLNARSKTYVYRISTGSVRPVFGRQQILYLPGTPDTEAMRRAARYLTGEHDFTSFCGNRHQKKSCVRRITEIDIRETTERFGDAEQSVLRLSFTGNGFLQNMVRILVGTLLEVGEGKRSPEDMERILNDRNRESAGPTAPAHGLTLLRVEY